MGTNLIKFPMDKIKPKKTTSAGRTVFDLENRKVMISASFLSFLFLVTMINSSILSSQKKNVYIDGRGIASIQQIDGLSRNTGWEHQLAEELSKKPAQRGVASIARTPTAEDDLLIGLLQGKYSVRFDEGKISEISFSKGSDEKIEPKYVEGSEFISKHRQMLPVDFSRSEKTKTLNKENEEFSLFGKDDKILAKVHLKKDSFGRLLSMKIEKTGPQ